MLRVGRAFLKGRAANKHNGELPSEEKEEVYHGFLTMLDEVVFPALSLMPCNCGMAEETWAMVKQLPYETRWVTSLPPYPFSQIVYFVCDPLSVGINSPDVVHVSHGYHTLSTVCSYAIVSVDCP